MVFDMKKEHTFAWFSKTAPQQANNKRNYIK